MFKKISKKINILTVLLIVFFAYAYYNAYWGKWAAKKQREEQPIYDLDNKLKNIQVKTKQGENISLGEVINDADKSTSQSKVKNFVVDKVEDFMADTSEKEMQQKLFSNIIYAYEDLQKGTGNYAACGAKVDVTYLENKEQSSFTIGFMSESEIDEAIIGMREGGARKVFIPDENQGGQNKMTTMQLTPYTIRLDKVLTNLKITNIVVEDKLNRDSEPRAVKCGDKVRFKIEIKDSAGNQVLQETTKEIVVGSGEFSLLIENYLLGMYNGDTRKLELFATHLQHYVKDDSLAKRLLNLGNGKISVNLVFESFAL